MRTIETQAEITSGGVLTARVAADVEPGQHRVVIVIDDHPLAVSPRQPLQFAAHQVGLVSDDFTFRREDLYDDNL